MSEDMMPDVYCSFLAGAWYVSGRHDGGLIISGPTLTEAVAAFVVALAHGGKTDPVEWQLSPLYRRALALDGDDATGHPADGWPLLDPTEDEWIDDEEEDPTAE